ncbi:MAG: hypothetical protein UV74_C0013G0197 [Candidatus Woesebacteria bacterium GW2011_GWB1_43_14]|uniref:DUF192 domain-containing protein n=1 Tax=Candidatus Woesebacteria bacterium GW2011_GWB1_43_14 TaxID=1618578 RepID=A0A0G1DGS4_9BACT|nr:MAG: hypothetical protein UT21_C0005G0024 [Candidatus Woesebacteria bacterium GW2011_GWA1_39_11b]KKS77614.1 MAG: hypothetical protein UV51_C0005G0024 [Candidatus Woesebacteria bacterium GW2011_GWC1_42_9]KKS97075.1 MAG: hypothetical protein UV74_C0013G0197 [Candidatus Woesebacteria bacterium GW2011_GWB1_43_14]
MEKNTLHIHPNKFANNWHIIFIFLPSIIFVLLIALAFKNLSIKNSKMSRGSAVSASDKLVLDLKKKPVRVGETGLIAYIADSDESRKLGLSNRSSLASDEAMLFVFDKPDVNPPFWMKDMHFPIDIIWINDGKVIFINENVEPAETESDLKLYLPPEPIDYVLEVNAGFSAANKLELGNPFIIL